MKSWRFLNLLLAYALLWPISAGDKMVMLSAPSDSTLSSPWQLYRDLGCGLFGVKPEQRDSRPAFSVQHDPGPVSLLAFQKPEPAPTGRVDAAAPRRLDERELRGPRPPDPSFLTPLSPVVPFHLDSKK